MKTTSPRFLPACLLATLFAVTSAAMPPGYKGKPYQDSEHTAGAQAIPGTVQCALYDLGGVGVAYQDTDAVNHGSELNHTSFMKGAKDGVGGVPTSHCEPGVPASICFFREHEGVDISYTKSFADFDHGKNLVAPPRRQLYIGWTEDGEWTNYTVYVAHPGRFRIVALYSNQPNVIKFDIDGKPAAECKLPVDTTFWHIWNKAPIGEITFPSPGLQVLTLHYNKGNNFATFDFERIDAK